MAVPQCHSPGCRMLKVLESSSGVGAGGLPLPLSAPPCPVPGLSRSHGAEPWRGFLPRAWGAAPFPQLASARALLCLAVSSRHGSSSAWERWEAGCNWLQPAGTRWNRLEPAGTSCNQHQAARLCSPSCLALCPVPGRCACRRSKPSLLWLACPPVPSAGLRHSHSAFTALLLPNTPVLARDFLRSCPGIPQRFPCPWAQPCPDLETGGAGLCSAVPKCQLSAPGTSLGGYFPSLRKNVRERRAGMAAPRTLLLQLLLC